MPLINSNNTVKRFYLFCKERVIINKVESGLPGIGAALFLFCWMSFCTFHSQTYSKSSVTFCGVMIVLYNVD